MIVVIFTIIFCILIGFHTIFCIKHQKTMRKLNIERKDLLKDLNASNRRFEELNKVGANIIKLIQMYIDQSKVS